jgi:hypothetical protein
MLVVFFIKIEKIEEHCKWKLKVECIVELVEV